MARSISQLAAACRRPPWALALALTLCGCARPPAAPPPPERTRARVLEIAPAAWRDAEPGSPPRDTLVAGPAGAVWLRFRLPAERAERAFLRLWPVPAAEPARAELSVDRFEPALKGRARPPAPGPRISVAVPPAPARADVTALVDAARNGPVWLRVHASREVVLWSPLATEVSRQPRLELWLARRSGAESLPQQ